MTESSPCKPRNALVLIRIPKEKEQRSSTGLYLPNMAGQQFRNCEVIEVGEGTAEIQGVDVKDLEPGQRVLAKVGEKRPQQGGLTGQMQWSCIPLSEEATTSTESGLFLINQHDILAILPETENPGLNLVTE